MDLHPPQRIPRKHGRKVIYQRVHWDHRSAERLSGRLHDISAGGAFLSPAANAPGQVCPGDTIWIELSLETGFVALSSTVRWCGFSERHGCSGFGVEFDERTQRDAGPQLSQLR